MGGGSAGRRLASKFARLYGLGSATKYGRVTWLLAMGTVVSYLGRGAAVPFVVVYLTQNAGLPLAAIGLGVFVEQVTRALASPVFGGLSDKYGRKPFMVGGVILQAAVFPAYLLVHGVPSYVGVSVLAGLGQAPYQPALSAFLADTTPVDQRVGVFGLVQMTKNLGWSLGVLLGGLLVGRSFRLLFLVGGALPLVYAVLLLFFVREPSRSHEGPATHRPSPLGAWRHLGRSAPFAVFVGLATVIFLTWGQLNTVLPVFVTQGLLLDDVWVTRVFAINSVLIVLFQVPVSSRVEGWSRTRGLALATAMNALGYVLMSAAGGVPSMTLARSALLAGVVVLTLAEMLDTPLTYALALDLAPAGARGGAMGVLALAAPVGMGAAPLLAGIVTASSTWRVLWALFAGFTLAGAFGFLALGRLRRVRSPEGGLVAGAGP